MRVVILMSLCAVAAAAAASISAPAAVQRPQAAADRPAVEVVRMAADSLVARRRVMPDGGSAWRSSIQAPHHQTDRDVGAASIGAGLLAAYAVTRDGDYLRAARAAGDFLLGVAEPAAGGLRWPDWADPDGHRSDTHFTSFDDGAAGISDYLWTLYDVTHESRFRTGALAGMRWLVAQAEGRSCPETACSWRWTDDPAWQRGALRRRHGPGGHRARPRHIRRPHERLDLPSVRTCGRCAAAGADGKRYPPAATQLRRERDARDRVPVRFGGSRVHVPRALPARSRSGRSRDGAPAARVGRRPEGRRLGGNGELAVRRRRGRLDGLGLRARSRRDRVGEPAGLPHHRRRAYRTRARRAGSWLRRVAVRGGAWEELPGDPGSPLHVGLDSGAAGIGWVLEDLARAGIDTTANRSAARTALAGLRTEARHDRLGAFWYESRTSAGRRLRAEPSWHWGAAGIAAFAARLAGWSGLTPAGSTEADPP